LLAGLIVVSSWFEYRRIFIESLLSKQLNPV